MTFHFEETETIMAGPKDGGVTAADETHRLITLWVRSEKAVSDADHALSLAHHALSRARSERDRARQDVFKWLVPEGAKIGEKFSVWCGDSLYTCERVSGSEFSITESQRAQKA